MELADQIQKFKEFFEEFHHDDLLEKLRKGDAYMNVPFTELAVFSPDLATVMLEAPEDTIKAAQMSLKNIDLQGDIQGFEVRFHALPSTQHLMLRNIRANHIGRFLQLEGIVRQKSDVRPQVTSARFECPSCGNIIPVLQLDQKFREPSRCPCGRKGKFRLLSKQLVDAQKIVLEEAPEDLEGGEQPKRLNILLQKDLVSPMSDKKTNPGSKIVVTGIVKEVPITLATGGQSTRFDLMIDANFVDAMQEDYTQINISPEEEQEILDFSRDNTPFMRLVQSLAPTVYGHDKIKEALILQLLGGARKTSDEGLNSRGDIHVLLIGDPGSGKSTLLKRVSDVAPKARFVSGKGASGAGLTASVVKDEFLRGWALEAGALVLANRGVCCTTADTEFILENGQKMSFKELFENKPDLIYPRFKVLGLNNQTKKIEPFSIKQAFRIKNDKRIFRITTRTGREIELTEDNEVLTCSDSQIIWKEIGALNKGAFLAVPKRIDLETTDSFQESFAYLCGLIASDGSIQYSPRRAKTAFYNTNEALATLFASKAGKLGIKTSKNIQKRGRVSAIRGKTFTSKKDLYQIYNSQKKDAEKFISFGIPAGNKSLKHSLDGKILSYSGTTLAAFMRGVFDGDGSIRLNPVEVIITTGIKENASLFQEILARFGIVSSVKKSTNSWHCEVRGTQNVLLFFNTIGTEHEEKKKVFLTISTVEVKERLDVLPHHEKFFQQLLKKHKGRLGAKKYKYFWNYGKKGICPSIHKLKELNKDLQDEELSKIIETDILWDKIIALEEIDAEYVYDFTMKDTNNFVANNTIMHNCIDELDKMTDEDRSAMHEALEQQTVTISKANIQATLRSETTVLAAANPKFGRFDPYELLAKQIDLPSTLINRFDLIFPVRDLPNTQTDEQLAHFILKLHQNKVVEKAEVDPEFIRKYLSYARTRIKPKLTNEALEEIKEYYVKMRNAGGGEGIQAIPISARQLEALVRLSEASAKTRLSTVVEADDAKIAVDLVHYCLSQIGMDPDTGKIDVDRFSGGITAKQRSGIHVVKEVVNELSSQMGDQPIPIEDLVRECEIKGVSEQEVDEVLEKLKRSGDLYSPKQGFISKI